MHLSRIVLPLSFVWSFRAVCCIRLPISLPGSVFRFFTQRSLTHTLFFWNTFVRYESGLILEKSQFRVVSRRFQTLGFTSLLLRRLSLFLMPQTRLGGRHQRPFVSIVSPNTLMLCRSAEISPPAMFPKTDKSSRLRTDGAQIGSKTELTGAESSHFTIQHEAHQTELTAQR